MHHESLPGGEEIPALGLGTWDIGGGMSANHRRDKEHLSILRTAFEMGYTHVDTAEMYGDGHTEELIGEALQGFERKNFFITTKVSPSHLDYAGVMRSMDGSLRRLKMDYVDLYLIHWPSSRTPLGETFQALNEIVVRGKTRYLGVSNFSLGQLKNAQKESRTPIITNQIPYSLRSREYARNGVIDYCVREGILITAYSPIKTVNLRSALLKGIAKKYQATPAQIALAWILNQTGMITIPKSANKKRLRENLKSQEIALSLEDMSRLNQQME